jgi:hypothetical protein
MPDLRERQNAAKGSDDLFHTASTGVQMCGWLALATEQAGTAVAAGSLPHYRQWIKVWLGDGVPSAELSGGYFIF